jgi:indolepyruvate ferredoxin oxidoreductase alpha subunit
LSTRKVEVVRFVNLAHTHCANVTFIILDNSTVAMTGCQTPILTSARLPDIARSVGADDAHVLVLEAKGALLAENTSRLRAEIDHRGLSVVIFRRECLESLRAKKKMKV